ncbi:MAG: transcriptional regulator [Desulfurococcus sp.]|nr:transcriptional regulator [Desulfurococcus sp.]
MSRDQLVGVGLLVASIIVILVYAYILFFTEYSWLLVQITLIIAVAGVFGILGWIGYTLATTPPPKPIEEIEKEIEAELKKLQEESTSQST